MHSLLCKLILRMKNRKLKKSSSLVCDSRDSCYRPTYKNNVGLFAVVQSSTASKYYPSAYGVLFPAFINTGTFSGVKSVCFPIKMLLFCKLQKRGKKSMHACSNSLTDALFSHTVGLNQEQKILTGTKWTKEESKSENK